MAQGLKMKFDNNLRIKQFLLDTGDKIIVEAAPWDKYWGSGISMDHPDARNPEKWPGLNKLGFLLMKLRDFYRNNG